MGYTLEMLKSYNDQVRSVYVPSSVTVRPEEFDIVAKMNKIYERNEALLKHEGIDTSNSAQLLYVEGGLFTDCCLERPVMNLTLTPTRALGNMIPVRRRNTQVSKYAFLTDISDGETTLPEDPCDFGPAVGDLSACFMETRKGRMSASSTTLELDRIIQKYCEGITDDLYLVGDVRGVSAELPGGLQENLSLMANMAVRRQFQLVGRKLQRELLRQFWTGDPTNAAVNTAGGGARQFWGLETLIKGDYATLPFVTGTNCDRLNADIKDFENTCVGAANANTGVGLYYYMQELEDTLTQKASYMGYTNVEWVWVMHPIIWSSIVKYLPCEMLSGNCAQPLTGNTPLADNVQININDFGIATVRQQLQQSMRIDVNGRTYRVILDDSIPLTRAGAAPSVTHTSDIYFIPLSVDGQRTLFWDVADYRAVSQALAPLPGGLGNLHGWHDGGWILSTVSHLNFCFRVNSKLEAGLVFLAPFLSGVIENVVSCNLQAKPDWVNDL